MGLVKMKQEISEGQNIKDRNATLEQQVIALQQRNEGLQTHIEELYEAKEKMKLCFTKKLELGQIEIENNILESQAMNVALNEKIDKLGAMFDDELVKFRCQNKELEEQLRHHQAMSEADALEIQVLKQQAKTLQ